MSGGGGDAAWRPVVPAGHVEYTWKASMRVPATAGAASATSAGATSASVASATSATTTTPAATTPATPPVPPAPVASTTPAERTPGATSKCQPTTSSAPRLPISGQRNILITSALPYVNNVPHLGNIIGCVLSADVYARFCRLRGHNCVYVCGTDEYGTATETKAIEAGVSPKEICDKFFVIHRDIYQWFDISFDHFGRTTTSQQTEIAQDIFRKCDANGYLTEDKVDQLYCAHCARFLADRFVEGVCPECQYDDARGDQCDKCGKLLNAVDLVRPRCKLCRTAPEVRTSSHLFLDLGKLQTEQLAEWVQKQQVAGAWTENAQAVTKTWLDQGLKPRCITRDLKWGTPVPKAGFDSKVFYVWFDAPIGYISITANYTKEWEKWWKNPDDVQLYQFMGKDNIPFHCVIFPASLMATREPYTLLHHINTTEYLNYETSKFSKSRGTGVFGDDAKSTGIPSEVWRYYMLSNRPEQSDTVFLWEDFQSKNNFELLNNVGNFVQRTLTFVANQFDGVVPALPTPPFVDAEEQLIAEVSASIREYVQLLEAVRIKDALKMAMQVSKRANQFMQDLKPWELFKRDMARCCSAVNLSINLIYWLAVLFEPFMPALSHKITQQLNFAVLLGDLAASDIATLSFRQLIAPGHRIGTPSPLFRRIEDAEVVSFRERFGGQDKVKKGAEFPLELVVGEIREAIDHPQAAHLYVLKVDIGEPNGAAPRTIVSGLKPQYANASDLIGLRVVLLLNLKYTNFKGIKSEGMLLTSMKTKLSVLTVEQAGADVTAIPVGTRIEPDGATMAIKDKIDPKTELKRLNLETGEGGVVMFAGMPCLARGVRIVAHNGVQGAKVQ